MFSFRLIGRMLVLGAALLLSACSSASTTASMPNATPSATTDATATTTATPAPGSTATATAQPGATPTSGPQPIHTVLYSLEARFTTFPLHLHAVNADTGAEIWHTALNGRVTNGQLSVVNGEVLVSPPGDYFQAYDAHTGALRWVSHTPYLGGGAPLILGNTAYFVNSTNTAWMDNLIALDLATGNLKWEMPTIRGANPLSDGSTLFVLGAKGMNAIGIDTFDAQTGAAKGFHALTVGINAGTDALVNGTVYTPCKDTGLCAIDPTTGALKWYYPTGEDYNSHAVFANGMIYVGSDDNHLYAINASTGKLQFRYLAQSTVHATPIIMNGSVYFGCGTKYYAINATTGAQEWVLGIGPTYLYDAGVVGNGMVYLNLQGVLTALDAATGHTRWTTPNIGVGTIASW